MPKQKNKKSEWKTYVLSPFLKHKMNMQGNVLAKSYVIISNQKSDIWNIPHMLCIILNEDGNEPQEKISSID